MFERAQKNRMRDYIGVSIYRYVCIYNQNMLTRLEILLLFKYVCYSDLPTEVNKILPPVSLHDGLSSEGSVWLGIQVLTSEYLLVCFLFTHLTLPHRECW